MRIKDEFRVKRTGDESPLVEITDNPTTDTEKLRANLAYQIAELKRYTESEKRKKHSS
jgi:hypothetical protein